MSTTDPAPRPLLGGVEARIRVLLAVFGVLVAVVGLAAPAASAGAATGAGNGVAAINPEPGTPVAATAAVSPAHVGVSGPVFDDGAVVSLVTPSATTAIEPSPWPPNNGAIPGTERSVFLDPGTRIDRYGYPKAGKFVSPEGTPYPQRSLRAGSDRPLGAPVAGSDSPYTVYEVMKPIPVTKAGVAPAFGQPGLGMQYELPVDLSIMLDRGIVRITQRGNL